MVHYKEILSAFCLSAALSLQAQEVTFRSAAVEDGIRDHLGLAEGGQITFEQLDTITTLDLSKRGITDVYDLLLMPELRSLDLSDNMVESLRPIALLESLESVDLSYNGLKNVNELFYSKSEKLDINVSFNNITDFSIFGSIASCSFTLEGAGLQFNEEAPYYDIYYLYTDLNEAGMPVVNFRGYTNITAASTIEWGSSSISAQIDGGSHSALIAEVPEVTTQVMLTNGEQSVSTYLVPATEYTVEGGKTENLVTGLPEDYTLASVYAQKGTVTVSGNTIAYTAPAKAVTDEVSFSYYQGSELKGFSRFYVNKLAMGDVNGDGVVNAADIVELVNALNGEPSSAYHAAAADVNGDGEVTADDVDGIVDIIMNKE